MYINGKQLLSGFYNGNFISKGYFNNNLIYNNDVVTITINPTPNDAKVTFSNYEIGIISNDGKSITVKKGSNISYVISAFDYIDQSNTIIVDNNQTINIELLPITSYTLFYPDDTHLILTDLTEQEVLDNNLCKVTVSYVNGTKNQGCRVSYLDDSKFITISSNPGTFYVEKNSNIQIRAYYSYRTTGLIKRTITEYASKDIYITNNTEVNFVSADYS